MYIMSGLLGTGNDVNVTKFKAVNCFAGSKEISGNAVAISQGPDWTPLAVVPEHRPSL